MNTYVSFANEQMLVVARYLTCGLDAPQHCTNLADNVFHSGALRTNNGGSGRDWQVIDYSVTSADQFSQV